MASEWRRITLNTYLQKQGDSQNCKNCHEIKLMSHVMKL